MSEKGPDPGSSLDKITSYMPADGVKQANDDGIKIPAVESGGRPAEGLPFLDTFLGLAP